MSCNEFFMSCKCECNAMQCNLIECDTWTHVCKHSIFPLNVFVHVHHVYLFLYMCNYVTRMLLYSYIHTYICTHTATLLSRLSSCSQARRVEHLQGRLSQAGLLPSQGLMMFILGLQLFPSPSYEMEQAFLESWYCSIVWYSMSKEKHMIHKTFFEHWRTLKNIDIECLQNWFLKRLAATMNQSALVLQFQQAFGCKAEKAPDRPSEETDQIIKAYFAIMSHQAVWSLSQTEP